MSGSRRAGEQFGRWKLVEELGSGGNGEVWKAVAQGGDEAALKILQPRHNAPGGSRYKRFRDEILALRRLGTRPGILPLLDDSLPEQPSRSNPAWFTMPVATGIQATLGINPPLRAVVEAVAAVAEVLAWLHGQDIFHRDIKPANLYRYGSGWAIGDFGLVDFPDKEAITQQGEKVGPAFYLATEMIVDAQNASGGPADVYSLAKTLWVLSTGWNYPPQGHQLIEYKPYTITATARDPRAYLLDRLIERATDLNPSKRPTMTEFAQELRAWLRPAASGERKVDFSDLAASILDISQPVQREGERRKQMTKTAFEESLVPVEAWYRRTLETLSRDVGGALSIQGTGGGAVSQVFLLSLPAAGEQVAGKAITILVQGPTDFSPALCFGVTYHLYDSGNAHIGAAHVLMHRVGLHPDKPFWAQKAVAQVGSAQEQNAIASLLQELDANLRSAMEKLIEMIRTNSGSTGQ